MTKFEWPKADLHDPDPAREQQVNDFVTPDATVVSVELLTPKLTIEQKVALARGRVLERAARREAAPKQKKTDRFQNP